MNKKQILKKAKENPKHILCLFTKDNFKIAKEFWGETKYRKQEFSEEGGHPVTTLSEPMWRYQLQQIVLEKDRIKYLEVFVIGGEK